MIGYIAFNLIFWCVYSFLWARKKIALYIDKALRRFWGRALYEDSELFKRGWKQSLFSSYFSDKYRKKQFHQEVFSNASKKLGKFHKRCFGDSGVQVEGMGDLGPSLSNRSNIFIGFHTVSARRRFLYLARLFDIQKFGFFAREREQATSPLNSFYDVRLSEGDYSFEVDGREGFIFNFKNPISTHSHLAKFLKEGGWLFITYDIPPLLQDYKELLDEDGNIKKPSKFVTYRYLEEKILLVSTYLLHLLKRTGVKGIPLYNRRLHDGRDKLVLGDPITISKNEEVDEVANRVFKELFDFMSENLLVSSQGWFNVSSLAPGLPFLRKPGPEVKQREWESSYLKEDFQLNSQVIVDRYDKDSYLLTSTSPIQSIEVGPTTKNVISELKRKGKITRQFRNKVSRQKLEFSLSNLWEAGVIDKID